jgi:hypothetical protein
VERRSSERRRKRFPVPHRPSRPVRSTRVVSWFEARFRNATSNRIRLGARNAPTGLAGGGVRPQGPRDLGTVSRPKGSEALWPRCGSWNSFHHSNGGGRSEKSNHFSRGSTGSLLSCCLWAELAGCPWMEPTRSPWLGFACRDCKGTPSSNVGHSECVPGRPLGGRLNRSSCNI